MDPAIREVLTNSTTKLAEVCQRNNVRKLELFGSAATSNFDPGRSDVDLLVTFKQDYFPGIADAFLSLGEDLEALFQRRVDLLTRRSLKNPYLKQNIDREAIPIYGRES